MKKTMLFVIVALAAIVLMTAFNFTLDPTATETTARVAGPEILYVCPAQSSIWDSMANAFSQFTRPVIIAFCFAAILLMAAWGWALYQNLLKDKFVRDAFKTPWAFTKILFWAIVLTVLVFKTPNYFRTVSVNNVPGKYVLCDANSPNARAEHMNAISD